MPNDTALFHFEEFVKSIPASKINMYEYYGQRVYCILMDVARVEFGFNIEIGHLVWMDTEEK
jgi:hypothetical protein